MIMRAENGLHYDLPDEWVIKIRKYEQIEKLLDGKNTLHIFINEQDEKIYIDERLLKIFQNDKYDKLSYRGSTFKAPLIVYDDMNICLGIILPVII